jgi:hypothetical protein
MANDIGLYEMRGDLLCEALRAHIHRVAMCLVGVRTAARSLLGNCTGMVRSELRSLNARITLQLWWRRRANS